jgi:hypothetical protein
VEQGFDDVLLAKMRVYDGGDMVVREATIADRTGPNRQIGTVVAPPLTATGPHIAMGGEIGLFEGID